MRFSGCRLRGEKCEFLNDLGKLGDLWPDWVILRVMIDVEDEGSEEHAECTQS